MTIETIFTATLVSIEVGFLLAGARIDFGRGRSGLQSAMVG